VPRTPKATTGVVLALALAIAGAGCGKDKSASDTTAQNATTTPAVTTTTGKAAGAVAKAKAKAKGKIATATTDALPSTPKKSGSASKSSASTTAKATAGSAAKKAAAKKQATKKKATAPTSSSGADLTSGTGSGPIAEREDALTALLRYYKAFIERDTSTVCSLLTAPGQQVMINDGNDKTCEASAKRLMDKASAENVALLKRTRDGLHVDDISVKGDLATAQIGKTSALHMIQENGRWLVRSPNVVATQ